MATPLYNINYAEFKNCIVDEVVLTKSTANSTNTKETWVDGNSQLLAKFQNNLEAGNISNQGVKIIGFKVKRREKDKVGSIYTVGDVYYEQGDRGNKTFVFNDYTQPNKKLVYSILPIGENGLIGTATDVEFESNFTGWWIVDKDTNNILAFDKALGSLGDVETSFTQDRTVIETFGRFPQVYYLENDGYHQFTLSSTFLPDEGKRSGEVYENLLTNFIRQHKPFLAKNSNGAIYICDISNPRVSSPTNNWKGYDYINLTVDVIEVMTIEEYMAESE